VRLAALNPHVRVETQSAALTRDNALELLAPYDAPHEWAICGIPGARLVPLGSLAERAHELDRARTYVLQCRSGQRSARAAVLLRQAGFRHVLNLRGGVRAWAREVDPSMPTC